MDGDYSCERSFFQEPRFSAEVSAFCTDPNFSAVSVSLGNGTAVGLPIRPGVVLGVNVGICHTWSVWV